MIKPAAPTRPADRRAVLETISRALCGGVPADPARNLAAWTAGVAVVECLERAGFTVVRCAVITSGDPSAPTVAGSAS